ncbi:MAG: serine/threonine protein phosphatase [Deltaproteobacteria bacterium]|nr:serine/threonine protein phosphatase [Deltaproteobacteria bacterium]
MTGRTFAFGDVHGELAAVRTVLARLPPLRAADTLVFVGDYLDRGPQSAQVVEFLRRELPASVPARVVALKGNHEDAWLRVRRRGWPQYVVPVDNGCLATYRSFVGGPVPAKGEFPANDELLAMLEGTFFPDDVAAWMEGLPAYHEDEHAIYVHAGLPKKGERWAHPSELEHPAPLLWLRDLEFVRHYHGKLVVFGHTATAMLPQELSHYTVHDPTDMFGGEFLIGLDTRCGHEGGFLTAVELPALDVYESR